MATSGSFTQSDSMGTISYTFSWNRTSYSVTSNTSTISWTVVATTNNYIGASSTLNYVVTVDGQTYSTSGKLGTKKGDTANLGSGSTTMTNSADGTKTFSFSFGRAGASTSLVSGSATLDAIPRPATITGATDFNDEVSPTIMYTNISGNLVTALDACISFDGSKDDIPYRAIGKTERGYTFGLTDAERKTLRQRITSGNSTTVRFYVRTTIDNEVFWSYLTRTFTLINYTPTLSPTVTDANPNTAMLTGDVNKLIRYYSNANVTFNAAARKEATLVRKTATNGSQTFNIEDSSQNSVVINGVDDNVFTLSVTDSRGYTTSQQVHFKGDNFIPYFSVTCNQTVRLNLDGTAALTVKGNYFNGSFGAANNTLTVQTRHRRNGGEWSEWGDISPLISDISNGTYTLNSTLSGYDPSGTYDFQCRAFDKLTTAESAIEAITLKPIFDWGKYDFNFNVPLTIEENPLDDFVIETGTEAMGSNGTWYWRKWKNGRAECYGCRNYGAMAVTTTWGSLYRSGAFTQDLPSGLFVSTPEVIDITFRGGSNVGGWIASHENSAPSASVTGSFILVRPASATLTSSYLSFNVIGRWK